MAGKRLLRETFKAFLVYDNFEDENEERLSNFNSYFQLIEIRYNLSSF